MVFDFDKMMVLARENPGEFERQRSLLVDELVQSRVDVEWARAFQCRIDLERRRVKNPLGCCLRLYSMMGDKFIELNEHLQDFLQAQKHLHVVGASGERVHDRSGKRGEPTSAKILMFKKP